MANLRIGITGTSGFIGKHIVRALHKKRNVLVFGCDKPEFNLLNPKDAIRFVRHKNVIVHAAAINRGTDSEIIAGNVVVTHNLISAILKLRKKPKVIFLSSIHAETDTIYGKSKRLAESLVEDYSRTHKGIATILRFTNIFGEGSLPFYNTVVATFCHQIANNQRININKKGAPLMLLYIGDAVRTITEEIFRKRKQNFYFKRIYTKNIISLKKLSDLIFSFRGLKGPSRLKTKFEKDLFKTYRSYVKQ